MTADAVCVAVDREWMRRALALADHAAAAGEVPVGAVLVRDGEELAAGAVGNYRLPGSTLYATMEPCPMCAGAIVQARVARGVYAARDERWGAVESVFEILGSRRLNHRVSCEGGLLAEESARRLKDFFEARR